MAPSRSVINTLPQIRTISPHFLHRPRTLISSLQQISETVNSSFPRLSSSVGFPPQKALHRTSSPMPPEIVGNRVSVIRTRREEQFIQKPDRFRDIVHRVHHRQSTIHPPILSHIVPFKLQTLSRILRRLAWISAVKSLS